MTYDEMIDKWKSLKNKAIEGENKSDMELLDSIDNKMFSFIANKHPEMAMDIIDTMNALSWNNYVTMEECEDLVSNMLPQPVWTYEQIITALKQLGLPTEEEPYYNEYALVVAIQMIYSDDSDTIAKIMGRAKEDVENTDMLKACYYLALDRLKDTDGQFSIREYFELDDDEK